MASASILSTCVILIVHSIKVTKVSCEPQFECGADFACLLKATAFIDKTAFIRVFLSQAPKSVLTVAPKCFGKSTIVNMLKRFLEIEVDETGKPKTKVDYVRERVNDTDNYHMFVTNQLAITHYYSIMEEHFGRHPVITVDFRCGRVSNFNDIVNCCRRVVHRAFLQHKYVLQNPLFSDKEKEVYEKWSNNRSYVHHNESEVRAGLNLLSGYLYKHFKRRSVYVLVDEYDALMTNAMFTLRDESVLHKILKYNTVVLADSLESYNYSLVAQGLLTGVAYIDGMDWYSLTNVVKCRFLERHPFLEFYGLSRGEINTLLTKPEFTSDLGIQDAKQLARNGFTSTTGRKVYSYRSILI